MKYGISPGQLGSSERLLTFLNLVPFYMRLS